MPAYTPTNTSRNSLALYIGAKSGQQRSTSKTIMATSRQTHATDNRAVASPGDLRSILSADASQPSSGPTSPRVLRESRKPRTNLRSARPIDHTRFVGNEARTSVFIDSSQQSPKIKMESRRMCLGFAPQAFAACIAPGSGAHPFVFVPHGLSLRSAKQIDINNTRRAATVPNVHPPIRTCRSATHSVNRCRRVGDQSSSGTPRRYKTLLHLRQSRNVKHVRPGISTTWASTDLIKTSPRLPVKLPSMNSSVFASCTNPAQHTHLHPTHARTRSHT